VSKETFYSVKRDLLVSRRGDLREREMYELRRLVSLDLESERARERARDFLAGEVGLRVDFMNINDMYNNDAVRGEYGFVKLIK